MTFRRVGGIWGSAKFCENYEYRETADIAGVVPDPTDYSEAIEQIIMCNFTETCEAGQESYWEDEPTHIGGASIGAFGCKECGYCDAL